MFAGSVSGTRLAEWTYDTLKKGLPTASTRFANGQAYTSKMTAYDDADRPTATEYSPYGEPLRMTLAAADSTANVSVGFQYYEATRRLKQTTSHRETSTGYLPVTDLNYSYDQIGNITQITDEPGGTKTDTQCFTYDYLRRLTQAWTPSSHNCATTPATSAMGGAAPYWLTWTFDKTGNRLTEVSHAAGGDTTRTHTYPAAGQPRPHAVQAVTTSGPAGTRADQYGYDATGNTTSRGVTGAAGTLDYDVEGRLAEATDPDAGTSTYVYDADGARLLKREPDATTLYLPGMELRRDATTGTVSATRYYMHNNAGVAVRTHGGVTWTLPDHHGTVAATVSSDATRVTRRYRDPYGNPRGQEPTSWPDWRGYLNAPTDVTGLTHLGARQYDPTTGRFLSVDPVLDTSDPQQFNAYAYGRNNPVTFADPSGLWIPIGNSGPWVDSGGCRDGDCWDRPHGQPGRGGGDGYGGGSAAEQAADRLNEPALGEPLPDNTFETLREQYGYTGSQRFSRAEALDFAMVSDETWRIVCQVFNGPIDECMPDAWNWDGMWEGIKRLAEFTYQLTPIADAIECAGGSAAGCAWLAAGFVPGVRFLKGLDNIGDAAKAGKTGSRACSFTGDTEVLMADGTTKPISQVKVGDQVLAADPETGERGPRFVTAVLIHPRTAVESPLPKTTPSTTPPIRHGNAPTNSIQETNYSRPTARSFVSRASIRPAHTAIPPTISPLTISTPTTSALPAGTYSFITTAQMKHGTLPSILKDISMTYQDSIPLKISVATSMTPCAVRDIVFHVTVPLGGTPIAGP